MYNKTLYIIYGPTCSGKSDFGVNLAKKYNSIVVNADSVQVYKELPTLSAQPKTDQFIKHLLYGVIDGKDKDFSVSKWLNMAKEIIDNHNSVIFVGGSSMYIRSLCDGISEIPSIPQKQREDSVCELLECGVDGFYKKLIKKDPEIAGKIDPKNKARLLRAYDVVSHTNVSILEFHKSKKRIIPSNCNVEKIMIDIDREELYARCDKRFDKMIKNGAIEEVADLLKLNYTRSDPVFKTIGAKEIADFLEEKTSLDHAIEVSKTLTRRYAKKQITWARNKFDDFTKVAL